jgi:ATP-dependent DNA helicase RecG
MARSAKSEIHRLLAAGEISIVIGTHALLEESVEIPELALAVVDEQHRFGVQQRAGLRGKGWRPHLLAMSATPIPRSLTLTLYGDLDLSTLRELPAGRRGTETRWMRSAALRREAYKAVCSQVAQGRQAFVVCPHIEESEQIEARAATVEHARLSADEFRALEVGLLHGRMSLSDKQQVMRRFRACEIDVLVATPVIEVGIDVPNATVMLIESADRFGLSQLHQLRGRVGRGEYRSQCLLLADDPGGDARERLAIVERTSDGFELAEEDLRIRGPGDYLGARQSGFPELKVATLADLDLLAIARAEAADVLAADPGLSSPEHTALKKEMDRAGTRSPAEIS